MDNSDVRKVMLAVAVYWPRTTFSPPSHTDFAVEMWSRALRDLQLADVLTAVELLRDEPEHRVFAPTVGAIRARTTEMLAEAAGNAVPDVGDAWRDVQRQISAVGHVGIPTFSHPVIASAVDSLGWMTLCMSTNPDVTFAHFRDVYRIFAERERREQVMTPSVRGAIESISARPALP